MRRESLCSTNLRLGLVLSFCLGVGPVSGSAQQTTILWDLDLRLPTPLFARWTREYNKRSPQIQMQYLPVGTSEGIKQVSLANGDFGVGEAPLS
jgi:ABC-type phosphate transport system substrate-binding protein